MAERYDVTDIFEHSCACAQPSSMFDQNGGLTGRFCGTRGTTTVFGEYALVFHLSGDTCHLKPFSIGLELFQIEWLLKKPFFKSSFGAKPFPRMRASFTVVGLMFSSLLVPFSDLLNSLVSRWGSAEIQETAVCWIFITCSLNSCASNSVAFSSSSASLGSASLSSWSSSVASISLSSPARYLKQRLITGNLVNALG